MLRIKNVLISNMESFISKVILCENRQKQQKEAFSYFDRNPILLCVPKSIKAVIIIIHVYQFGTEGHTQKARSVQGAYPYIAKGS